MDKTYAIIKKGQVINTIVWDGESDWEFPKDCLVIEVGSGGAEPGGTYDGKKFIPVEKTNGQS